MVRGTMKKSLISQAVIAALAHDNAVRGVEIFAPGKHNGDEYTEKDIDDMISAFGEQDFRPALKIGHTKDAPGAPAYGYVTNLRKQGGKMVADFESMHDTVIAALKDRRYDRVSSEIYFNLKRGAKTFRRALKAVALLGAEVPAVANLVPLHKMEFAADGFENVAACEQALEVQQQALIDSLQTRVAALSETLTSQKEQDTMTIKELNEKKAQLEAQLADLKKAAKVDDAKVAELTASIAQLGTQMKALEQSEKDAEELKRLRAESESQRAALDILTKKDRERDVADKVAKCTIPAFVPNLRAAYSYAVANPTVKVKHFTAPDKDGKSVESEKTLTEVLDSIVGQINEASKKLFAVVTKHGEGERKEGAAEGDPGAEVDRLAKLRVEEKKSRDYDEAVIAVLEADPELARRYNEASEAQAA